MVEGKCRGCGHIAEFTQDDIDDLGNCKCGECGEYDFEVKGVNDDEEDEEEEEEEEDEELTEECQECGDEIPAKELIYFEEADVDLCKRCIDKYYPREKEIVEKVVEKIVDRPVIATDLLGDADTKLFKPETKTQFD